MSTSLLLALKYLKLRRNAVSVITLISILGVLLGVAVLVIVLAVMTGFTDLMKTKLLETQAHFHVRTGFGCIYQPEAMLKKVRDCGTEAAPLVISPVVVQMQDRLDARIMAIGASTGDLQKHLRLDRMIRSGDSDVAGNRVVISTDMAQRWQLRLGDRILLHAPHRLSKLVRMKKDGGVELNPDASIYLPGEFTVAGFYSFGKYDFDRSVLFIDRDDAADFLGLPLGAATQICGWVKDPFRMQTEMAALRQALPGYLVTSWMDENQQLLGVLRVEKNMMFFLLVFIVLVAAFSIANTLITSVYQKTREIGILKAIGATDGMVMRVFLWQGFLVGVAGSLLGTLLGGTVLYFRNDILAATARWTGHDLFPKEFYYFNELPAHIVPEDVCIIIFSSILLCTIGAVIPAIRAARLAPAGALRYE